MDEITNWVLYAGIGCLASFLVIRFLRYGFFLILACIGVIALILFQYLELSSFMRFILYFLIPYLLYSIVLYVYSDKEEPGSISNKKYRVVFNTQRSKIILDNIRRGVSVIGSAGSGKTESVVYNFLQHFAKEGFCGVLHDYKNFEITEMAYPLFEKGSNKFFIVSFDPIYHRVNPIAPKYLPDEESVSEISRVLLENLLEIREPGSDDSSRFFKDAVEGLICGLVWRLKTDYPDYCTIPHMIALYQYLDMKALIRFLEKDLTSKAMADAFINGTGSSKQTAGVRSTLSNAFKKISTKKIFMVLAADDISLNINNPENPAVICVVNNPKIETSLSPVIAGIMHTITKQMSERGQKQSFVMMEEASTIRLLNMHRIPATLRSYDIVTLYVLQDKIQNDMLYGDKGSKAILSNLSYQFFGKANDPDTAFYYERFFEIIIKPTLSVSKSTGLSMHSRITKGEKEVSKTRADAFFGLKQGEFIVFADGKDKRVQFRKPKITRALPEHKKISAEMLEENFKRIHFEIKSIFNKV